MNEVLGDLSRNEVLLVAPRGVARYRFHGDPPSQILGRLKPRGE
ncbi:MAG: hypothetical protein WCF36_02325 [Candidatus Nanopelagicales bacterium]